MITAAFTTLGCKVNQYETQRILESFEERGFQVVPFTEPASVYVVNTCSVTAVASSKSRQVLRRARRTSPNARLVVTGCEAEAARRLGYELPEVDLVVPNTEKLQTLRYFLEAFPEFRPVTNHVPKVGRISKQQVRTRAVVKVQDGCNIYCSYCSIPFTRPKRTCRPWHEVVTEVEELVSAGHREVVLTGVLLGDYGPDTGSGGENLVGLCERLARVEGLERIRISSIEATQVSRELLRLLREEPKMCKHLHVPLQSGSSRVLKEMGRPYTRQEYTDLCRTAKKAVPGMALTTDVMVGFPTEDECAFEETLEVVSEVGFAGAHVFRYSPRPGTPAAELGDPVGHEEKMRRSKAVSELAARTGASYRHAFLGQEVRVLVEGRSKKGGLLTGRSDNYLCVEFPGPSRLIGELVEVKLVGDGQQAMSAELTAFSESKDWRRTNGRMHIL